MHLKTQNAAWGFYGTIECQGHNPDQAWAMAAEAITAATGGTAEAVRDFLDSKHGRFFADALANHTVRGLDLLAAISATVAEHLGWRIDRHTTRHFGIPRGLNYLAGWVGYFEAIGERS